MILYYIIDHPSGRATIHGDPSFWQVPLYLPVSSEFSEMCTEFYWILWTLSGYLQLR